MEHEKKAILLAGPTASGKSKLAINIAQHFNGEIINADSMQIYKEISILNSSPVPLTSKVLLPVTANPQGTPPTDPVICAEPEPVTLLPVTSIVSIVELSDVFLIVIFPVSTSIFI